MDVAGLISSFRTDTDDKEKPYLWGDDDLIRWLNEAIEEACIRKQLIFEKFDPQICEIDLEAGTTVYQLHESIIEIVKVNLVESSGKLCPLGIKDSIELDRTIPEWRTRVQQPENVIHYDNSIEFDAIPDTAYKINLEVHRLPLEEVKSDKDIPVIHRSHHLRLIDWIKHRAYAVNDADALNLNESAKALDRFESYFGFRPDADLRKDENANRPHVNKLW